ncbi:HpcH/HpaI aldolase family protein [Nocardia salmonicida]|uniref:HpcH/HpaI aldolase family protein n=1 Tax=Nocardia salmonicida TaxID=53431 RepID=UPI0007A4902B|nr:aldolase/citrate lyase family protein [Nocardia salmonicida]
MTPVNHVRRKLADGEQVHGLFCSIPAPALVEMVGWAGYDFVIIDAEHTLLDPQNLENLIRAAQVAGLTPLLRVAPHDTATMLRGLDAGVLGIVVPHVRSRADVDAAIRAAYYAPVGMRSLGSGRAAAYGLDDPVEQCRRSNTEVMLIALIEDADAVDSIDDILRGGGVDMVLPGIADLSQSLGVPWQLRHEAVQSAVKRLHESCMTHNVAFCALVRTPERHEHWRAAGVRAFTCGDVATLAAAALRANLTDLSP